MAGKPKTTVERAQAQFLGILRRRDPAKSRRPEMLAGFAAAEIIHYADQAPTTPSIPAAPVSAAADRPPGGAA